MNFGFLKNGKCVTVGVFEAIDYIIEDEDAEPLTTTRTIEEAVAEIKSTLVPVVYDDVVSCPDGFGQGDIYENGAWSKEPAPVAEPTIEDYLVDLDYRVSMVELGL